MPLAEQLANVGSEVDRVAHWRDTGDKKSKEGAAERALELLDFTISDTKNKTRLLELLRLREVFCDTFLGDNQYGVSADYLEEYFLQFAILANKHKFE